MPLTAFDPETGQVVLATWPVSSPQCKDPTCRAKLHLAEEALLQRRRDYAKSLAQQAKTGLKTGSADWIRANDILSYIGTSADDSKDAAGKS